MGLVDHAAHVAAGAVAHLEYIIKVFDLFHAAALGKIVHHNVQCHIDLLCTAELIQFLCNQCIVRILHTHIGVCSIKCIPHRAVSCQRSCKRLQHIAELFAQHIAALFRQLAAAHRQKYPARNQADHHKCRYIADIGQQGGRAVLLEQAAVEELAHHTTDQKC